MPLWDVMRGERLSGANIPTFECQEKESFLQLSEIRIIFILETFIMIIFDGVSAHFSLQQWNFSGISLDCLYLQRSKTPCPLVDPLLKNPGDAYVSTKRGVNDSLDGSKDLHV